MRETQRDTTDRVTEYRTWGLRRRADQVQIYDPGFHVFINRVAEHLGLNLIEVRGDGEPTQYALGEPVNPDDSDSVTRRVTPFFSSLESLDYFCRINLQSYLAVDVHATLPRRWFWQEAVGGAGGTRHTGGQASIMQISSLSLPGRARSN